MKEKFQFFFYPKRCRCSLPEGHVCAKVADINPAENMFNLIQMELKEYAKQHGWPKNADELADRIEIIINEIPKEWYTATFQSLEKRWKTVKSTFGKNTDYHVRKHS